MKILNTYVSKLNIILLVANITIIAAIFIGNSPSITGKNLSYQTNTNEFIKKELNFTDEQYEKYLELNKAVMKGYKKNEENTCKDHTQFLMELSKDKPSIETLDSLSRRIGKIHTGLKVYTARHFLNIKSICTPEQEEKLQRIIKEMLHVGACKDCTDPNCYHRENAVKN